VGCYNICLYNKTLSFLSWAMPCACQTTSAFPSFLFGGILKILRSWEIEFDEEYWAEMEQSLNKFYTTHMPSFILESAKAS